MTDTNELLRELMAGGLDRRAAQVIATELAAAKPTLLDPTNSYFQISGTEVVDEPAYWPFGPLLYPQWKMMAIDAESSYLGDTPDGLVTFNDDSTWTLNSSVMFNQLNVSPFDQSSNQSPNWSSGITVVILKLGPGDDPLAFEGENIFTVSNAWTGATTAPAPDYNTGAFHKDMTVLKPGRYAFIYQASSGGPQDGLTISLSQPSLWGKPMIVN